MVFSTTPPPKTTHAEESVWQPRFPQVVFFVEALNLSYFNKSGNRKGMWKSIFATSHTDSEACATRRKVSNPASAAYTLSARNSTSETQANPCEKPWLRSRSAGAD